MDTRVQLTSRCVKLNSEVECPLLLLPILLPHPHLHLPLPMLHQLLLILLPLLLVVKPLPREQEDLKLTQSS
jgi:hypothetical protein